MVMELIPSLPYQFALALGTLLGMTNGVLSNILKVHPLIITLGTAFIYKGIGYIIAGGRNIDGLPDFVPGVWTRLPWPNTGSYHHYGFCGNYRRVFLTLVRILEVVFMQWGATRKRHALWG